MRARTSESGSQCCRCAPLQRSARRAEAAVPGVVDERGIVGHVQPAAPEGAEAEVVLLAIAEAEALFVEETDVIEEGAADVETDADAGRQPRIAARRDAFDERAERKSVVPGGQEVLLEGARHGTERGVVRQRRDGADVAVRVRRVDQLLQPARRDDRIAVEQDDVALRLAHATVRRPDEAAPLLVANH